MANYKITDLVSYSNPDPANDVIEIVDFANNQNKKISRNNLLGLTSAPVGLSDNQTLTNKALTAPTIASPVFSGTITGTYTLAGTPTFPSSVVTLTGSQTLTNKVLTSPTINSPTITNASITSDAITGFSNANNGSIFGLVVTGSQLGTSALATNAVQANQLATSAITLGYTQTTSTFNTASTTPVQVTGLTVTVTIPSGGRKIKITAFTNGLYTSGQALATMSIWDGTVNSGTQLAQYYGLNNTGGAATGGTCIAVVAPSAGSKTYNVGLKAASTTATVEASATSPAFILVEAI